MAAPMATEQPTINKAWEALLAHVPTMVLIWVASAVLAGFVFAVYALISLIGVGIAGGQSEGLAANLGMALGQLGQLPFTIL